MPTYYQCERCTACCRWPGQVRLTESEITAIAAYLDISEEVFIQTYTRLNANRSGLALTDHDDESCIFLEGEDCKIQPVKPNQCRAFPNLWNFPGFEKVCHAKPVQVSEETFRTLCTAPDT